MVVLIGVALALEINLWKGEEDPVQEEDLALGEDRHLEGLHRGEGPDLEGDQG